MSEVRIGISGWTYAPWRGVFYPENLPRSRELEYASRQVETIEIKRFFSSGVLELGEKLGPVLWQLPPNMKLDLDRVSRFLTLLPGELRHALEPRHESFADPRLIELLGEHGVALVVSHSSGHWPMFEELTANFVYLRLHGEGKLYSGGYGGKALDDWAAKIRHWTAGRRNAYVYFDNDVKVRAPADAIELAKRLAEPARKAA